jgi:hypothetical protein
LRRDVWEPALAIGIAVMVLGMLVYGSTAGSEQSACEAWRTLMLALEELVGIDLDDTGDAAVNGALTAVGSAARSLAEATDTAESPEYRALDEDRGPR